MQNTDYFLDYNEDEQHKELYAQFGLCIYFFQVLEHQLINMILLSAKEKNLILSQTDYDAFFYSYSDKAMGTLQRKVIELYNLPENDQLKLENIRKKRNYFVHNYFKNHSENFSSVSKRLKMLNEFIETREQIQYMDEKLEALCNNSLHKVGLTQEILDSLLQSMLSDNFNKDKKLFFGKREIT